MVNLNNAEARLKAAQISNENAKSELSRFEKLHAQGLISETEFNAQKLNAELRKQELDTAENNVQLVKVGASKRSGAISNVVYSTVDVLRALIGITEREYTDEPGEKEAAEQTTKITAMIRELRAKNHGADWTQWSVPSVIDELKARARGEGLWNLFLPTSGLSTLEYAPLAEAGFYTLTHPL